MLKPLITSTTLTLVLLASAGSVYAQNYQYVTPQPSQIAINKLVKNPSTNVFVDNLGFNDPRLSPGQEVTFQIQVKNTGAQNLTNLTVKDQLPNFVDFVAGPGNFDNNSKVLTFTIDSLNVNETKTFEVKVKVRNSDQVPSNQVTCVANMAEVTKDNLSAQDSAQFCFETTISKGGVPTGPVLPGVTTLPKTGVADTVGMLAIALGSLLVAIKIWAKKIFN